MRNLLSRRLTGLFLLSLIGTLPLSAQAQVPDWIWSTNTTVHPIGEQTLYFRYAFKPPGNLLKALLTATADDNGEFFLNGKKIGVVTDWRAPLILDVTTNLRTGENVLAIRGVNRDGPGAVLASLALTTSTSVSGTEERNKNSGQRRVKYIVSGSNWLWSAQEEKGWSGRNFDDSKWSPVVVEAHLKDPPWSDVMTEPTATPVSDIKVEPGFKVELLHSADATEGSWISMAIDDKGRLIISPQSPGKLLRITLKMGQVEKIDRIDSPVGSAMGLLYAEHSLYVNGHGPDGTGIYRLKAEGDYFAPAKFIRPMVGEGEHGSHGMRLGPDHKIYVVSGNFTKIPPNITADSPFGNFGDDQLLPRASDGRGFGTGQLPPGGAILRMDLDGSHCQLFAAGSRNTYDITFNPDGELFGFDSDMEWDWGSAWYRPIRINHWTPGADFGYHEGSGKFPEYYEDTLPATYNVGVGSPTGVEFGTKSNFPEKYRSALFLLDWSYGRIFAAHLTPQGASYSATLETILRGIPLNVTALGFGQDGAMYFITGGRGTQSGLYRLTYVGPPLPENENGVAKQMVDDGRQERQLRHDLEFFEGKQDPRVMNVVWPFLGNDDRWVRYAARTALEFQDVNQWRDRAERETDPEIGLTALLALARCAPPELQGELLQALQKFSLAQLSPAQQLLKLRVLELSCIRQGRPPAQAAARLRRELDPFYPASTIELNHELCQLLLYLKAPDAVSKTLALLRVAPTQEDQTFYVLHLRTITNGWTMPERKEYLGWFQKNREHAAHPPEMLQYFKDAGRSYSDGASLPLFFTNFLQEAVATLSPEEMTNLADFLPHTNAQPSLTTHHKFIKDWQMQDLQPQLTKLDHGRSYDAGKKAFTEAQCILCHRFGSSGGSVGPELAAVSSRLTARDILESILLPSKVVSEQYQNTILHMKDGDDITGQIAEENDQIIKISTNPLSGVRKTVNRKDVASRRASHVSPMPEGLANVLTENQILDLIAYLQSGGKKTYAAFAK